MSGLSLVFTPGGPSGSGTGGPLAVQVYAPATQTIFTKNSATISDVDATNAAITFTAPASGNVLVRCGAFIDFSTGTGDCFIGLREGTTDLTASRVLRTGGDEYYASLTFYLSGISAGSHTYKLSFVTTSSATMRIIVQDGQDFDGSNGWAPLIMEVWAAP